MTKKKDTSLFAKARRSIQVNLSLIIVVVTALVLEGGGLMQYFYYKRESSDPRAGKVFVVLLILGLVMVVLLMVRAIRSMRKIHSITAVNERMENELYIAREIQMSMLPKIFPPYPERSDIDMYARIVPAKEVGGDLYDFFIRGERLYFCIGDVSGKGVPASLVMAVTRSLFRTVAGHEKSPARIVTSMNDAMSEMNESSMFVTFLAGTLDLHSGHLRYCNAGHNAPVRVSGSSEVRFLDVEPNIPIGIQQGMSFREQETDLRCGDGLFLYTDGVTEAENAAAALFGEERLLEVLSRTKPSAKAQMDAVTDSVGAFVGNTPQSDDQTVLIIRFTNEHPDEGTEKHLILHNDIQQIPQLAEFIGTVAEEARIADQSLVMSLNLALEEAVSNVILYAYPPGSDGLVDVEAIIRKDRLDFIISDSGEPFNPTAVPDADITLGVDERAVGGLGIYLVRNIMDTVEYERTEEGKNILSMTKKLL